MAKMTVVEFIQDVLKLELHVLSDKGWYRVKSCPFHEETKGAPAFGILTEAPFVAKCFSCGPHGTLVDVAAYVLQISKERAAELINRDVDIKLAIREPHKRKVTAVPDAVVEMYEYCFDRSLGEKYIRYRGIPKYMAKLWQLGYSDLERSLTIPLRNTVSGFIQSYQSIQFNGGFDDVFKLRPADAGCGVTVPSNYKEFDSALVVEGLTDAIMAASAMWGQGIRAVPVALSTALPSKEQLQFIRRFKRVILGCDHDASGQKSFEYCRRALRDKAYVYEFVYPDACKDPGQLTAEHKVSIKLIL